MRSMYELLREGVFYNRQVMFAQQTSRAALLDQHRSINAAIQNRDPEAAAAAVRAHLGYVEQALRDDLRARRNAEIAEQRLARERRQP